MRTEAMNIERHYQSLIQSIEKTNVDFWGINIIDSPAQELAYKIYHSQKISKNSTHPLAEYVYRKGMLRYFADVTDSTRPGVMRMDISLYQRNDVNIEGLFEYLAKYVPFFESYVSKVKSVSEMKITNEPGYRYASLYHVGLIEENNIPQLLKFHFFTRWCENPNRHTKEGYRDDEFLEHLQNTGIEEYRILKKKAAAILHSCGGHLWMAGMDISSDKIKYKIYIKDLRHAYEYLQSMVGADAAEHLKDIAYWNENHNECRLAGVAIALDTQKVSSLNFYYHVD